MSITARELIETGQLNPGITLLEASAGTGKTHQITNLVVRLVAEHGIPMREILVVTFTKAATAELIGIPKDVYAGLLKSFVFGVIIAIISCAQGLRATGGALGVGHATRGAVRDSIIAIIISNYFMTWLMYQA